VLKFKFWIFIFISKLGGARVSHSNIFLFWIKESDKKNKL
jgi:hypothetical protein